MKKIYITLTFLISFANLTQAKTINHEFDVFIGKFNASRTTFEYSLNKDNYKITSDVKTFGVFDSLYPFSAQYSTSGLVKNNQLITTSYKYNAQSRFSKRHKELVYDKDGTPIYRISSKNDKEKKVIIQQETINKGTTDLQSVFAELALQYNNLKFCDSTMEVFDGKRRFNVIFKDEGQEQLKPNEYSPFQGLSSKCSMYIDNLGEKGDDLLWDLTSDRPIYIWLLEDKKTKAPFIARINVSETPLGELNVYTKKIHVKED